jgi:hypothetical protein
MSVGIRDFMVNRKLRKYVHEQGSGGLADNVWIRLDMCRYPTSGKE